MEEGEAVDMVVIGEAQATETRTPGDQPEGTKVGKGTGEGGPPWAVQR